MGVGVTELEILGDELAIHQAAPDMFDVPRILRAVLLSHAGAHIRNRDQQIVDGPLDRQGIRDRGLNSRLEGNPRR